MYDILLIDDDPDDAWLTRRLGQEFDAIIEHAPDGPAGLAALHRRAEQAKLPDLVLLDINMPGMNGHGVLRAIRGDEALRLVPIVMLTTSDAPRDIEAAATGDADGYITKPVRRGHLLDALDLLRR